MGEKPFFTFDILAFSERDVETLDAFAKANFETASVRQRAEDIIYTGKLTAYVNELLRNPSESFTRFILGEINITTGKLTAKRLEKFVPIVKKAIQTTLLDMATRSIKQETEEAAPVAAVVAAVVAVAPVVASSPAAQTEAAPEQSKGVVTTQEEIDAFEIVSRICADSTALVKAPVQYRDAVNYFGINIGNYKKWFMRLFFDGRRKSVVTRVPLEKAALLAHGFEVEAPPESIGKSRIYITSLKDLERLRPLILLGYEDEMKRSESGAEDDDAPPATEALRH